MNGNGGAGILCTQPALVASVVAGVGPEAGEGRGRKGRHMAMEMGDVEVSTGGEARNQLSGWMSGRI